jgi:hypothetical protein
LTAAWFVRVWRGFFPLMVHVLPRIPVLLPEIFPGSREPEEFTLCKSGPEKTYRSRKSFVPASDYYNVSTEFEKRFRDLPEYRYCKDGDQVIVRDYHLTNIKKEGNYENDSDDL